MTSPRDVAYDILANTDPADLPDMLRALTGDSLLTGTHAAVEALGTGQVLGAFDELDATIDWDAWTPGNTAAADLIRGTGLQDLLDQAGVTIKGTTASLREQLANRIADGIAAGDDTDTIATACATLIGNRADLVALTETARAMSAATIATYRANGLTAWDWLLSPGACPECESELANNPHSLDDDPPPKHPRCRCAASPAQ